MKYLFDEFSIYQIAWAACSPVIYGLFCIKLNRAFLKLDLLFAFFVGFLTSYVAYVVEVFLNSEIIGQNSLHTLIKFTALVALPEEIVKLAAIIGITHNRLDRNGSVLIIACFVGCGFAASENIVYMKQFGENVVISRFFTATAFHVFNSIVMARILINTEIVKEELRLAFSLIFSVIIHGLYDYLVVQSSQNGGQFLFIIGFTSASAIMTLKAFPMHVSHSDAAID